MSQSFKSLELSVIRWSESRHIIPHSTPDAQFIKAVSEMGELADAISKRDIHAIQDAVGDTLVCLINVCALLDLDITSCLGVAWDGIKDRRGQMNERGVFIKE